MSWVSSPLLADTILLENKFTLLTDQEISVVFLGKQVTFLTDQEVSPISLENPSYGLDLSFAMLYLLVTKGISTSGLWHITTATHTIPSFCKLSIEQPSDTSSIKYPFGSTRNHVMTSISRQQIFSGKNSQIKSIVCRRMKINNSSFYVRS